MNPYYYFDNMTLDVLNGFYTTYSSISGLLGIATYVLTGFALYTIANRRGLKHVWLAWILVAKLWLIGSISDQYRYIVKGENKSKRKVLLGLGIAKVILAIVMGISVISMVFNAVIGSVNGMAEEQMITQILSGTVGAMTLLLPVLGVAIAQTIVYFMAMYDIYKSLDPSNCVVYLVLSILFSVTEPFFLFFNRNKDQGMPPRKDAAPAEPQLNAPSVWQDKDYL